MRHKFMMSSIDMPLIDGVLFAGDEVASGSGGGGEDGACSCRRGLLCTMDPSITSDDFRFPPMVLFVGFKEEGRECTLVAVVVGVDALLVDLSGVARTLGGLLLLLGLSEAFAAALARHWLMRLLRKDLTSSDCRNFSFSTCLSWAIFSRTGLTMSFTVPRCLHVLQVRLEMSRILLWTHTEKQPLVQCLT